MELLYHNKQGELCISRCYGLDGCAVIPDVLEEGRVTELSSYIFSEQVRGRQAPPDTWMGEPAVQGEMLTELQLPRYLRKVGAYALYNCSRLKRLSFWSTTLDWGAGVFTGCSAIERLEIRLAEGRKSCFQEVISELHQTLTADLRDEDGRMKARLIFPEYYEESVENTPARIIMREVHGCGHMYRYCFQNTAFAFGEYDSLFPYVQVQEKPELVVMLALYRLYWPWGLEKKASEVYEAYVKLHPAEAAAGLLRNQEEDILLWLAEKPWMGEEALKIMTGEAAAARNTGAAAGLMDLLHRRFPSRKPDRAADSVSGRTADHVPGRRSGSRTFEL